MVKWQLLLLFSILLFAAGCSYSAEEAGDAEPEAQVESPPEPQVSKKEEPIEEPEPPKVITIKAIGDILIHDRVYRDAETENGYDFDPMFEEVSDYLQDADITMANQETLIGGEEIGLSSYPSFNSPKEVGDALKNAGVDIVTIANNHTLDRGEAAIQSSIENWNEIGIEYTGAYKNEEDSEEIRVIETDAGISVAFLSYTSETNGIPVPAGKSYLLNLVDPEKIAADIEKANELADAVVVSYHTGVEYEVVPRQEHKDLAQLAADYGADAVISHHPHVLQPAEWVEGKDGNKTFVMYSLGNFLSGQDEFYNQIGGIASFDLREKENGEIEVINPALAITFVNFKNEQNYRVLPMYELTADQVPQAPSHYQQQKEHVTQWMPDLEIVENW